MTEKAQPMANMDDGGPVFLFAMGELSGQVKSLTAEISQMRIDRVAERKELLLVVSKQDDRLTVLEAWRWRVLGASGIVSFVMGSAATYVWGK